MHFRLGHLLAGIFMGLALANGLGCDSGGGDDIGKRYSVSGRVTYKGNPVPKGSVLFTPLDDSGRPASGNLQKDGSYTLTTATPGDGALAGKYRVGITAVELDYSKAKRKRVVKGMIIPEPGIGPLRATKKEFVPLKYSDPTKSKLTAEVKPESNKINFELPH